MTALFVENWIVYSFFSVAQSRIQVSVIEIYDAGARHLSAQEVLFGTPNQTMSSYEPVPLEVRLVKKWGICTVRLQRFL